MNIEQIGANRLFSELKAGRPSLSLFREQLKNYGSANIGLFAGAITGALSLIRKGEEAGAILKHEGKTISKSSALSAQFNQALAERDLMMICELTRIIAGATDAISKSGSIDFHNA